MNEALNQFADIRIDSITLPLMKDNYYCNLIEKSMYLVNQIESFLPDNKKNLLDQLLENKTKQDTVIHRAIYLGAFKDGLKINEELEK